MQISERMATPELILTISRLSKKIDTLLENQSKLQQKVNELEIINSELNRQHEIDVAALTKAQKDLEFLSLSHRLADSPEALIEARTKVSKLIRTIDSCIRLIIED